MGGRYDGQVNASRLQEIAEILRRGADGSGGGWSVKVYEGRKARDIAGVERNERREQEGEECEGVFHVWVCSASVCSLSGHGASDSGLSERLIRKPACCWQMGRNPFGLSFGSHQFPRRLGAIMRNARA